MPNAGRILITRDGTILADDSAFIVAMRAPGSLIGANALDITAPGDRDRCITLIERLVADGTPIVTTKRLIRSDGTQMWVRNHLALTEYDGRMAIEVLLDHSAPPAGWVEPARLLASARMVFDYRRHRDMTFGTALFGDHAWDLLLAAYIHEAEGMLVTIARIHALTGMPLATGSRWIRALSAAGLMEYEDAGSHELVTTPFRLTCSAHTKFERYLSDIADAPARESLSR